MPFMCKNSISLAIFLSALITISMSESTFFNPCEVRLIQPIEGVADLSYIVANNKVYFMIAKDNLDKSSPPKPNDLPVEFTNPTGVVVHFNRNCTQKHFLHLINGKLEGQNHQFSYTALDLNNWKSHQWTASAKGLPEFLKNEAKKISSFPMDFSMFWYRHSLLFIVQRESRKQFPFFNDFDYFTLKVADCDQYDLIPPNTHQLNHILQPWNNFEPKSCFIYEDKQIICYGPKSVGFTSYDIDKGMEMGNISVTNGNKTFKEIPIMKIVEQIVHNCEASLPTTEYIPPTQPKTTQSSTESDTNVTGDGVEKSSSESALPTTTSTIPTADDKQSLMVWIVPILILLAVIILVLCLCFWWRNSGDKKDGLPSESGAPGAAVGADPELNAENKSSKGAKRGSKVEIPKETETAVGKRSKLENKDPNNTQTTKGKALTSPKPKSPDAADINSRSKLAVH